MGNRRGLFLGGRYVLVTAIQRWPLSRFDCIFGEVRRGYEGWRRPRHLISLFADIVYEA